MKITYVFLIIVSLYSCKTGEYENQKLSDLEWESIILNTKPRSKEGKSFINEKYGNIQSKEVISWLYLNCTDIGYESNNSILNYLNNRTDKEITNKLDTLFNINFVSNVDEFKFDYFVYSEPFYVNDQILFVAIWQYLADESTFYRKVFFLKKLNGSFETLEFYDVEKDRFYTPIPPPR